MEQKIIINYDPKQTRVALLEDGKVVEIYFERPLHQRLVGNIYKGVVENVLPGMQAAFVNIGEERNAFYYVDEVPQPGGEEANEGKLPIQRLLRVKDEVLVQVMKESFGSKGARLTGHVTLPGRYLVLMPGFNYVGVSRRIVSQEERERLKKEMEGLHPSNMGVIVRTAAEGADTDSLKNDLQNLLQIWQKINNLFPKVKAPALLYRDPALIYRIVRDLFNDHVIQLIIDNEEQYNKIMEHLDCFSPHLKERMVYYDKRQPIFEHFAIEEEIERSLNRMVWLKCGGYLVFDETEALTAIDVNTGKYTGKSNLEETILKTNLEAVEEVARQIRLRDIGGIIIIDFIDMHLPENRQLVLEKLKQEMNKDRTKSQVLGITSLGLVEVSRKKVKQGLSAVMLQPCPYCHGKGKTLSLEAVSSKVERELKQILLREDVEAILVEMNSEVAALLIGSGGTYLKKLEASTGKNIFIRGSDNLHVEKYNILMSGDMQEVARYALPVQCGGIYRVVIEEPHSANPEHGIARLHGYVLDIEGGGELVGEEVQVVIKETTRTFAKAVLWKRALEDSLEES
ncbi:MAG TPA: ribonuclease G [Firmicutes bacterium]|jgi:ribonuclease G|nr:Rne/Rng family ribonuclease [Bacillota bacterium]HAA34905.1 ribonuclease G [Bacillota bacterium]